MSTARRSGRERAARRAGPSRRLFLAEGVHTVTAVALDKAGNRSDISSTYHFTIDTTAPTQAVIDLVTSAHGLSSDGYTVDQQFMLSGHAEIGTTLQLYDGSRLIATPVVDATGQWTTGFDGTGLADARHSFTIRATDLAGNLGLTSVTKAVTVDTVAPAPTLTSVTPGATSLSLSGKSEAGRLVKILVDGMEVDPGNPTTAGVSQSWTKVIAKPSDAVHSIEVQAVDKAGNAGSGQNMAILGSNGADTIEGTSGKDLVLGGNGNDTFVFRLGASHGDSVTDFTGAGSAIGDRLEFRGFGSGWLEQVVDTSGAKTDTYVIHADTAHGNVTETIKLNGVTTLDVLSGVGHGDVLFV